ncbi:MAG: trypsin-like peptidase domain-containing protein [Candidatus Methanomethylophilaceae archaeon]|nr:trypsin-like peptidase domain-containing protein [Candidatus Methanomethylophilaceae archaeon]
MFADACAKAMQYTKPLIISTATVDGTVNSGFATFFFINREGWAITAAHCVQCVLQQHADAEQIRKVDAYNAEHPDDKKPYNPKWLKAHALMWGGIAGLRFDRLEINLALDIALVKFAGLPPNSVTEFPVFKEPASIRPGMSICRLGFPFIKVKTDFIPAENRFALEINNGAGFRLFPYEGMVTGTIIKKAVDQNGHPIEPRPNEIQPTFIECSTPGLIGQSGGPIVDKNGFIVGMQSQTVNLPMGFGDKQVDGKYMPEQFMNIGMGVHVSTIIQMMKEKGVSYKSESDDDGYRIVG